MSILKASEIDVSYGKSKVINNLSLEIKEGSRTAILGRNGVGKTTFMKSAMGILPLGKGKIEFNGKDITTEKTYKRNLDGIGYVPQGREIIPLMTVEENLNLGAMDHKGIDIEKQKVWVLNYFPALTVHLQRNGGVLSGGLQQQLAIARCLMGNPRLMLLDEPTEGIQPNVVMEIADTLKKIAEETGITIVVVEQNLKFARRLADNYIIIQKGTVVAGGDMSELSDDIIKKYLSV